MSVNTSTTTPETTGFFGGVNKVLPFIQGILTVATVIGLFVVATRDTQKDQSFEILNLKNKQQQIVEDIGKRSDQRDKQIEELKKNILTKEVFDVYMRTWTERQDRQEQLLNKILENQK